MREVLGISREWGVLAWDVAGKAICYMCMEAVGYMTLVSLFLLLLFLWKYSKYASPLVTMLGSAGSDLKEMFMFLSTADGTGGRLERAAEPLCPKTHLWTKIQYKMSLYVCIGTEYIVGVCSFCSRFPLIYVFCCCASCCFAQLLVGPVILL